MAKRRKRHTFKSTQVRRVHPNELPTKHHHTHEQINADKYELEPVSRADDRLSVSTVFTIRSESPPIEVIEVSPPKKHKSQLTTYHPEVSTALVPVQSLSMTQPVFRSFIVSPNSNLLREVSLISVKPMPMEEDEIIQKSIVPPKKQPVVINIKPRAVLFVVLALILAISIGVVIVLSVLLAAKYKEPNFNSNSFVSSACGANCMMSLTPYLAPTIALWQFDGSLDDKNNIYLASYTDPPSVPYVTGNVGQAVSLAGVQYLYASTQFMNLSYQSWTIEAWLVLNDLSVERGIFGQCESSTTTDKCLSLSIKNQRLHSSFNNNDLDGTTILSTSSTTWRYVVFVYDYTAMQQSIYLDGVLEATTGASGIAVDPYEGASGQVTTGWTTSSNPFNGYIDQLQVSSGAKTACQILNDATLTAYYPFDVGTSFLDLSNNAIHGSAVSLITVSGRVNQAYSFQYSYSYFQSLAFTAYSSAESFTVSLWAKPFYINGGSLIHLSSNIDGSSNCFDLLGFSSTGQLIAQLIQSSSTIKNIGGPTMTVNIWTHIVLTYSSSNGMALYTNGTLQGTVDPFSSFTSTYYSGPPFMTVGNARSTGSVPSCTVGTPALSPSAYRGYIDELRVYSRELTVTEICSLFNP